MARARPYDIEQVPLLRRGQHNRSEKKDVASFSTIANLDRERPSIFTLRYCRGLEVNLTLPLTHGANRNYVTGWKAGIDDDPPDAGISANGGYLFNRRPG